MTTCQCGATYEDTPDGIRRHQMIHTHRPSRRS